MKEETLKSADPDSGLPALPRPAKSVSVVLFLCISLGQAFFPWVMGIIYDTAGLVWGMLSNAACLLGTYLFARVYIFGSGQDRRVVKWVKYAIMK